MPADTFRVIRAKRWCAECGANYQPRRGDQRFCAKACRAAWHDRWTRWGKRLVDAALAWRLERRRGGWSLMTQAVADIVAEERDRRRKRQTRIDEQRSARGYAAPAPTPGRRRLADVLPPRNTGDRAA